MNRRGIATTALVLLALSSLLGAQVGRPAQLNAEQARQELEIMKGVLEATLRFSDVEAWEGGLQTFYLHGQGAVFVVPVRTPSVRWREFAQVERLLEQAASGRYFNEELLNSLYLRLEDLDRLRDLAPALAPAPPPAPPAPPAPPVAPAPPPGTGEGTPAESPAPPGSGVAYVQPGQTPEAAAAYAKALEARLAAFEERLEKRKEVLEQREQETERQLEVLERKLVEAVARHGDALTVVQAGEHITLVLSGSDFPFADRRSGKSRVLVIAKQSVLDYNAGRLSLDAFLGQVLHYEL